MRLALYSLVYALDYSLVYTQESTPNTQETTPRSLCPGSYAEPFQRSLRSGSYAK